MKRISITLIALAALGAAFLLPATASADYPADEGGASYRYFYGQWFAYDVHGSHHCC